MISTPHEELRVRTHQVRQVNLPRLDHQHTKCAIHGNIKIKIIHTSWSQEEEKEFKAVAERNNYNIQS